MRQGLLRQAPSCLPRVLECLSPVSEGRRLVVDMNVAGERGLVLDDFDSSARFLFRASVGDRRARERLLTKLLGPEWANRFPQVEGLCDPPTSRLAHAALACITAGGRKVGIIGSAAAE